MTSSNSSHISSYTDVWAAQKRNLVMFHKCRYGSGREVITVMVNGNGAVWVTNTEQAGKSKATRLKISDDAKYKNIVFFNNINPFVDFCYHKNSVTAKKIHITFWKVGKVGRLRVVISEGKETMWDWPLNVTEIEVCHFCVRRPSSSTGTRSWSMKRIALYSITASVETSSASLPDPAFSKRQLACQDFTDSNLRIPFKIQFARGNHLITALRFRRNKDFFTGRKMFERFLKGKGLRQGSRFQKGLDLLGLF